MTEAEILEKVRTLQTLGEGLIGAPMKTDRIRIRKVEALLLEVEHADQVFSQKVLLPLDPTMLDIRYALAGQSFARAMGALRPDERKRMLSSMMKALNPA